MKVHVGVTILVLLTAVLFLASFDVVHARTDVQLPNSQKFILVLQQQIQELKTRIADLQRELAELRQQTQELKEAVKITQILHRGVANEEVKHLQEFLSKDPEIYPEGFVTGYFGPLTEAAVKRFQQKHGIETIGVVGPKTLAKLNEVAGVVPATPAMPAIPAVPAQPATPAIPPSEENRTATPAVPAIPAIPAIPPSPTPPAPSPPPAPTPPPPPLPLPPPPPPPPTPPPPTPLPPPPPPPTPQLDTIPPVISGISVLNVTHNSAVLSWITNESATTQVEYGTSVSYGTLTSLDSTLVTLHSVSLSNLQSTFTYHFRVKSKDVVGNLAVSTDQTFTTLAPPDVTPPPPVSKVITTVDPDDTAWGISMAIGRDGFPVISYYRYAPAALKVVKCGNASCTTGNTTSIVDNTIGSIGDYAGYTSIAIGADGFPVISYEDRVDYDLKVVKCGNAACSAGNLITRVDTGPAGYIGTVSSIAIGSDGLPIISYTSLSGNLVKVVKCGNSSCSAGNVFTDIDTGWLQYLSITIGADGLPLISYSVEVSGGKGIRVAKCGNLSCSENTIKTTVDTMTSGAAYGLQNSITIGTDGLPVMSYLDMTYFPDYDLRVLKCGNATCSANNIITVVDGPHSVGKWNSIAIGADGLPIVSYQDTSTPNDLKVVKCGNASCSANNTISFIGSGGDFSFIAIGFDGFPVIAYDFGKLTVAKCADAACSQ